MPMNSICRRLGAWVSSAATVPVYFAETGLVSHLSTPRRSLIEFVLVEHGSFPLTVGDRTATVTQGQLALINAHFGNAGRLDDHARYGCISLETGSLPEFSDLAQAPLLETWQMSRPDLIGASYHRLCSHVHAHGGIPAPWRVKSAILDLLADVVDLVPPDPWDRIPEVSTHVRKALEMLSRDQGDPGLALSDIAHRLGISQAHLCRLFRRQVGKSATEYLLALRLRRAAGLLKHTSAQVKQIAFQVGFGDPLYFSRAFRAAYGSSPRQYRRLPDQP